MHRGVDTDGERLPLIERHTVSDAWALNTYVACDVRCTYCITQAQGISTPRFPRSEVAARLGEELDAITIDRFVVGPYCDVYPSPEAELLVTRRALEVLADRSIGFQLVTKGTTVTRDADLFRHPDTQIQVSLNTVDEAVIRRLEPGAASAADRLAAVNELAAKGVRVRIQVSPWIPGVSDLDELYARVDSTIVLNVTPLRLPRYLARAERAFGLTQAEVNTAYREEYERFGTRPNLRWSHLPPLDGGPLHISRNFGRREIHDWTPSAPAPDPGPPVRCR